MSRRTEEPRGHYDYVGTLPMLSSFKHGGAQAREDARHAIGNNLKEARTRAHFSQEEAGLNLGLSASQISRIEKGETEISLSRLIELCHLYGIDMGTALGLINDEERELLQIYEASSNTVKKQLLEYARLLFKLPAAQVAQHPAPDPWERPDLYNRGRYQNPAEG